MTANLKELHNRTKIFWYLVLGICIAALFYVYMVNKTVHNVAERQNMEAEIGKVNSKLSELEFASIAQKNKISPEYAYALGFTDVQRQQFISKKTELSGLSLKT